MNVEIFPKRFENWKKYMLFQQFALEEVNTKLNILNLEYQMIHTYNPIEHIISRVKNPESIIAKLRKRGYEPTVENAEKYLNDVAGIRIICAFTNDIYKIYELLRKQDDVNVIEVKDYIKEPKPNGYRSFHMVIEIPVFLTNEVKPMKVEIQIRTIAMDFWASLEHKIYYKDEIQVPKRVTNDLKNCADMIKELDKKMLEIKKEIDELHIIQE